MGSLTAALLLLFFLSGSSATCFNGGFQLGEKCNCPPMWTGDNCDNIICLNGGYFTTDSPFRCICPTGYLGVHCDAVSTFKRPQNAFTPQKTSFNFVMVNLFSTYWGGLVVSQFQEALNNHLNSSNYDSINFVTNDASPGLGDVLQSFEYNFTLSTYNESLVLPGLLTPGSYQCYSAPFLKSIVDLITGQNLRETAITILTQHPDEDVESFERIVELATSFDIRINVVFSDDDTFVRCKNDDIKILRDLASQTGGIFVFARQFEEYKVSDPLLDMVLTSHYLYEGITMDYGPNPTISFNMNVPPANKYYVVALADDGRSTNIIMDTSACNKTSNNVLIQSGSVARALYLNGTQIMCSVSANSTDGDIRLMAFGSDFSISPVNVRVYKSYVETPLLDSSNSQPNRGNSLYLSLHYEARSSTQIRIGNLRTGGEAKDFDLAMYKRENSVFDWISNNTVTCRSDKIQWIELTFTASMFEKRFFPILCVEKRVNSALSNPMIQTEHLDEATVEIDDTTGPAVFYKSLILAYSDSTKFSQYNSFIVASIDIDKPPIAPYNKWGGIRFDVQDENSFKYFSNTSYSDFQSTLYSQYGWNASLALPLKSISGSQVLTALEKIANSEDLTQNSLISVLLSQLPTTEADLTTVYKLVNMNVKVLFFIDTDALDSQFNLPERILSPLNQIAALTGGHFIVSNQNDMDSFRSLINSIYTSGPGQTLLLSKNIQPQNSMTVGSIDLTNAKEDVTVTVTLSTLVSGDGTTATQPMMPINLYFQSKNSISVTLKQQGTSNFYSASTTLSAKQLYNVKIILTPKPSLLRIWTTNTIDNDVQIKYKDFDYKDIEGPDDYLGASLSTTLQNVANSKTMSLSISDCSGLPITLYDVTQSFDITIGGIVNFVPFFCSKPVDASSCMDGTDKLYFAQITTDGGFVVTKSFICAETQNNPATGCDHTDSNGNYLCGGTQSPYTRGRAGKLIDCSDPYQSNLKYDPSIQSQFPGLAPFACKCPGEGPSCEQAICKTPNVNGGAIDAFYRTYTVILVFNEQDSDGYMTLYNSKFLQIKADNIWQYQLFVVCQYGEVVPMYIGTNADSFTDSFKYQKNTCNSTQQNNSDFNIISILGETFNSIGREQRGLTVIYHELSDSGQKLAVSDLEAFLKLTQQYNQQVFIFNAYEDTPNEVSDDLKNGIMSTGGSIIFFGDGNPKTMLQTILESENSLNGHSPVSTGATTVLLDNHGYLIMGSPTGGLNSWQGSCGADTISKDDYAVVCNVSRPSVQLNNLPSSAWYSVITQGNTPVAAIIAERVDDQTTAFGVNYTTGGPMLAVSLPDGYTVKSNFDDGARLAVRNQCTFKETTVNVFDRLPVGYNSIGLTMTSDGGDVSKVFPFGVTSKPNCQNDAILNVPYPVCKCSDNWEGPDCSRPKCQNGGLLSTWSNACNCRNTGKAGQFCEKDPTANS